MRKTRSAILGTIYNPFIVRYWLENFKTWQDKVDTLYICLDRFHCKEVKDYLDKEIKKFPKIKVISGYGNFPENMERVIKEEKEELIFLVHDDTYIYNPDILDKYFDMADEGKVVMPLQNIYDPPEEVQEIFKKKYPSMPWMVDGIPSYSFMMFFTFCSKENYLKTEMDFRSITRDKGFYIKELDYTNKNEWGGDTGFWQGLQFLYNNIEIVPIKANQSADIPHHSTPMKEFTRMVDEGLDWLHLQNIARTIPLWFLDKENWYEGVERTHKIHILERFKDNPVVLEDMALKIAWLKQFLAVDSYDGIKDFYNYVRKELRYTINYMGIDETKIKNYTKVIRRLGK